MLIETQRELEAFCERLKDAPAVCLDTEFAGEGRYYPEVGTIQVADGDDLASNSSALIDPVRIRDLSPLVPILTSAGIVKVFHASEQDLEIFFRLLGRPIRPVFDTQISAALLGYGDQISFRNLLEITDGIQLEKAHTFTDWLRRPLTSSQIEYALNDVRYLTRIYKRLVRELKAKRRTEWAREEFAQLGRAERFMPTDERRIYLRLKGADRLPAQALGTLQELAAWRELTARQLNIPPGRVAIDLVLIELARRPRRSLRDLAEVRGLNPRQIREFGEGILSALRRGERNSAPPIKRAAPLPPRLEPTVDFLSLCLRALAVEQSVSTGILATRSELGKLAAFGERAEIPLLRGWRREVAGAALLAALAGQAVARIVSSTRSVHLEWLNRADGPSDIAVSEKVAQVARTPSEEDPSPAIESTDWDKGMD